MAHQTTGQVLIVEDEFLVAMELEALLMELGYQVIGPAYRVNQAMDLARDADIVFAVLDINVAGTRSFPVADILRQRNIPFVFASGYGSDGLADGYRHETILRKPYELQDLKQAIAAVVLPITR